MWDGNADSTKDHSVPGRRYGQHPSRDRPGRAHLHKLIKRKPDAVVFTERSAAPRWPSAAYSQADLDGIVTDMRGCLLVRCQVDVVRNKVWRLLSRG